MSSIVRESSTEYKLLCYADEVAHRHMEEWFDKYALECPECGRLDILPPDDYVCGKCRNKGD